MKYVILFLFLFCLFSCKKDQQPLKNIETPFNYLLGNWERTNDKKGMITLEHWKVITPNLLEGHAYSLYKKDTIFNERMELTKEEGAWSLKIAGINEKPITFKVTAQNGSAFTAVNPENEFPKEINYSYLNDTLSASVAADSTKISFIFWRLEE